MNRCSCAFVLLLCGCSATFDSFTSEFAPAVLDDERRTIPLSNIHAFVPVEPMQNVRQTFPADARRIGEDLGRDVLHLDILRDLYKTPGAAPDLYLVSADSIFDAVSKTWSVIQGSRTVDEPARLHPDRTDESLWLVVHLGPGSGTPLRHVTEVTVEPGSIIARHERLHPGAATGDWQHYLYSVPLGKLEGGPYRLTLLDLDNGLASVRRRVWVPEMKRP